MELNKKKFLTLIDEFKLGNLTTESFHPKSKQLSQVLKENVNDAISILREIDYDALEVLKTKSDEIYKLQQDVQECLESNNNVFISGCGATGRLALSIETLYRHATNKDNVIGFMAGGDYALIRSVESFEDNIDYGKKQLKELGFTKDDLLLAVTEGGETSFVIGTALEASKTSSLAPYFVYCNPDQELVSIPRSNDVLSNDEIKKLNLTVGPMALAGSTRMQATTVQMLAVGFAILYKHKSLEEFKKDFTSFISELQNLNLDFLESFINKEYDQYQKDGLITYNVKDELAIAVLTDTTERAPTFSLYGFENNEKEKLSLSYLTVLNTDESKLAWNKLLKRNPRCLSWEDIDRDISYPTLLQFDISEKSLLRRNKKNNHKMFLIDSDEKEIKLLFSDHEHKIQLTQSSLFFKHMVLKLVLNTHSTLVMGLLGRFESNIMTYVRASNYKLIDRAKRYICYLLDQKKIGYKENEVIDLIFKNLDDYESPIVHKVLNYFNY